MWFSTTSKRRKILEKKIPSLAPYPAFTSASDSNTAEKLSSLASDFIMPSSNGLKSYNAESISSEFHGQDSISSDKITINTTSVNYSLGDMDHIVSDLKIFENADDKVPCDFLYYSWPEMGNFEDVDWMFSCDSAFGLGTNKEDALGFSSSEDAQGQTGDVFNRIKFPCPEPNVVENILENRYSYGSSVNNSSLSNTSIGFNNSPWSLEQNDHYQCSVVGAATADSKDGFIPLEQGLGFHGKILGQISTDRNSRTSSYTMINEHKNHINLPNLSEENGHCLVISTFELANDIEQPPCGLICRQGFRSLHTRQHQKLYNYSISPKHSDNCHLPDLASANLKLSPVKSEVNDFHSLSPRDPSCTSNLSQYENNSHDNPFEVSAVCGQREKTNSCRSVQSPVSDLRNGSSTVFDPGSGRNHASYADTVGFIINAPAQSGSLKTEQSFKRVSGLDDSSLEATSFRQLQFVMEQLDLQTKLCIRDGLYRLAWSANKRHDFASVDIDLEKVERQPGGHASLAEGKNKCNNFVDTETETNPIDRSIAELLFHGPIDLSTKRAHDSFIFKSTATINGGSIARGNNLSEAEKLSSFLTKT